MPTRMMGGEGVGGDVGVGGGGVAERARKILSKLYYDTKRPTAFSSMENVYGAAKKILPTISRRIVREWFDEQLTPSLHKPARYNFPRNKVIVVSIDDQWQVDLCDMISKGEFNDGYKYIMTVIDCFSKYSWARAIKNKGSDRIVEALTSIFDSGRMPKRIQSDKGSEFTNRKVQSFLKERGIHFFTTNSEMKASIVERYNRTLKGRMFKFFTANNTYRYIDVLPMLVDGYNNTLHSSIKMKPADVGKRDETRIRRNLYGVRRRRGAKVGLKTYKYGIGDQVRVSKERLVFGNGYHPNWTEEIFVIADRDFAPLPLYTLRDYSGETLQGRFYEQEIQRVTDLGVYRVEKVIRSKRINGKLLHLVKWKNWDSKFNSWVENLREL